ncbi:MAG: hypothetical protein HY513_05740 [Candidatus Aenigmarchaeota archaeon]|nr:hypothetical protein [Candidatus Aenigmarchaeota archaeon]
MHEFDYREEESRIFGKVLRPVIAAEVKSDKGEWQPFIAYIDSGADISIAPRSFGEALKLDLSQSLSEIKGVGDARVQISIHKVHMKINEKEIKVRLAIALIEKIPYLLGRADIFNSYAINFREKLGKIFFAEEK